MGVVRDECGLVEFWCDFQDCIWSCETHHEDMVNAVDVVLDEGWREVDGKWFCPAHAAAAKQKGESDV